MLPTASRPPIPVQLRAHLARHRIAGAQFETAWRRSVNALLWPHDTDQRKEWRAALRQTRAEWELAYGNLPTEARVESLRGLEAALVQREAGEGPVRLAAT